MGSTIGQNIKITLFGESHGPVVGVTIDGLKPGIKLDHEYIKNELIKRSPTSSYPQSVMKVMIMKLLVDILMDIQQVRQ